MVKKSSVLTGIILLLSIAFVISFGWGIKIIGNGLTTSKVITVADDSSLSAIPGTIQQPIDYHDTVNYFKGIIRGNPNDADATNKLADLYFKKNNFKEAIKYYKRVIELAPKDVSSYNNLGLSYHYLGQSNEGLKYVEDGMKIDPSYQRIWLTKGYILATKGKVVEAVNAWDRANTLDPHSEVGEAAQDFLNQYRPISSLELKPSENSNRQ